MTTRRTFLGAASSLAFSNLFSKANAADPNQTGIDTMHPELILHNGRFTTLDRTNPNATAVAIKDGLFLEVGSDSEVMSLAGSNTRIVDLKGKRVLPGLIDNHTHVVRGGLNYNMELRWDGVRSLADAMDMLKRQVAITPAPQWVRVVGGFTEHQFAEKRLPTIEEINAVAPDTPVFLLHLYDRALLNGAALRAVGYTRDTPNPPGGEITRDANGNPTGLLLAKPNAGILYSTLAKGPKLPLDYQVNSTRHFMRELNRLGVTGVTDAGGGFQNYPDDYEVIQKLSDENQMTVRLAYNLFTQKPKEEKQDFLNWTSSVKYKQGNDYFRHNGAGEMLVFSAADFEDFRQPRPEMAPEMEGELEEVVRVLAENRWPWRMHATYDETISRSLDVFEKVNKDIPLEGLNWFFDHAETISDRSIDRIAALGGGIATQHRMAYQGEYFVERYGQGVAEATPPIRKMLDKGVNVSAGTDATRVASYNPWVSLSWMVTGKTVGGMQLYPRANCLDRETALRMWTEKVTWFSNEEGKKGRIEKGQFADLVVPDKDFFSCAEDEISFLVSELTMVGGKIVYGAGDFKTLDENDVPPAMPDWSPVRKFGGYAAWGEPEGAGARSLRRTAISTCGCASDCGVHGHDHAGAWTSKLPIADLKGFFGALGCSCWAV
ncbi:MULTISPECIES: amidohydrolase [Rhizobium/Agrobacterium group]|uniref:amidohydrolase n=1 Tax=Rhizobium/Agrobacterium group TaxID=227290 RepID=UPI0003F1F4D8|nr:MULTISPECIES: amidohydrolase [Rhizobium/Agrobacterium group]AHK04014.1 exoenzymes regulatory protein AepA precursor [Agrobacterium tumefaciens LBA4213 (Ach5)]AKC09760.1 amidohydrolase [Agrobacterium tumefaciens]AYM18904.1 amidohydrolase [Agrobacterium tumefaciens]AYM70203.1 amidohydrolase [Agrobacterium tumefaciens]NIB59112.1 amidohydrolase [Agrobacterium tumefaciens]